MSTHRAQPHRGRIMRGALALVGALAVGFGAATVAGPAASAAVDGNVVVMGDSFAANPDQYFNTFRAVEGFVPPDYPVGGNCLQAPNNWPRQMDQRHGIPVNDWSCSGMTSHSALGRIDAAIGNGDIHPGTRSVVLSYGMNNYGPAGTDNGSNILDPANIQANYLNDVRIAADKIRHAAPHAKIVMGGLLSITSDMMFCFANVVPNFPAGLPIPGLADVETWLAGNQRLASEQNGLEFVDLKAESAMHSTCASDQERYVAGIIDTTTPDYNMMIHPSYKGSEFIANRMAGVV